MKPLVQTLAGVAIALALVASPAAGQGRERPAGGSGGGGGAAPGGGVRTGGDGGGGGAMAAPRSAGGGGNSGSTYTPYTPSGSGGSTSTSGSGGSAVHRGGNGAGTGYVRSPIYGTPEDRAVPRGARPNPGGPVTGEATVRPGSPGNRPGGTPGHGGGYYPYNPWYFYGYGAFGLGYLYADPFWWGYDYWPYYYGGYDYYGSADQAPRGSLKLKVEPRNSEVYIDGYYMGVVDDFDGVFQKLDLDAGPHRVEIRAIGYRTITFDVRIEPNDTVTYRGTLQAVSKK
jgi:hypothetical protein